MLLPLATSAPRAAAAPARDSAVYNDVTQARLRVTQCVYGGPPVDVYVNGRLAVNAGVPMTGLGPLDWSGFLYLAPGTYSVALVPTGQGLDHAFLGPLDVTLAARHRYTVAALGQADEASHPPLVIDETAAFQAAGRSPANTAIGWINNTRGVADLHFIAGEPDTGGAPYGGFKVATYGLGPYRVFAIKAGDQIMDGSDQPGDPYYNPPAVDQFDCFGGTFPGKWDTHTAQYYSDLNTVTLLQADTAVSAQTQGQIPSFSIFLAALQKTGLTDMLANGGPYMVFPPSDAAFAALPKDQLDAMLADPHALADMLRGLIVAGYYPPWNLGGGQFHANTTVTNLLGQPLQLQSGKKFTINGKDVGNDLYVMTANGSRVFAGITKVPLPASAPGMPTTGAGANLGDVRVVIAAALALLLAGALLRRAATGR
jgi:uncharacterized surface protein with fasciclin (FAS1) repeats